MEIFKGRLDRSHRGPGLNPFIKQRERERETACVLACLNVKIAHAIISDEKVGTEWICFNIADMGYHIQRNRGGARLLCVCSHSGKALTGVLLYAYVYVRVRQIVCVCVFARAFCRHEVCVRVCGCVKPLPRCAAIPWWIEGPSHFFLVWWYRRPEFSADLHEAQTEWLRKSRKKWNQSLCGEYKQLAEGEKQRKKEKQF